MTVYIWVTVRKQGSTYYYYKWLKEAAFLVVVGGGADERPLCFPPQHLRGRAAHIVSRVCFFSWF